MVSPILRLKSYAEPLFLLSVSLVFFPITVITHPFLLIVSPSTFRSKWFENFWKVIGPKMAASPQQVDHIESLLSRAHGTCLELGPGAGDQSYHLKASQITKMYGAEPNAFLHEKLLAKAADAGLGGGKYVALECGAQPNSLLPALKKAGVLPPNMQSLPPEGVFDTIIAVKSLCSAPQNQIQATMAIIQALLKPGGEFLFFEHLQNERDPITWTFVWAVNLIWPYIMGGCHMNSKLDKVLMGMGGWTERDLKTIGEHQGYEPFRQQGPQNKTNSAIQITHLPTGIVVKSQATRSRSQNYTNARRILAEKVELLQKGAESRVVQKAARAAKKKASADKKKRRKYKKLAEAPGKSAEEESEDFDDKDAGVVHNVAMPGAHADPQVKDT